MGYLFWPIVQAACKSYLISQALKQLNYSFTITNCDLNRYIGDKNNLNTHISERNCSFLKDLIKDFKNDSIMCGIWGKISDKRISLSLERLIM